MLTLESRCLPVLGWDVLHLRTLLNSLSIKARCYNLIVYFLQVNLLPPYSLCSHGIMIDDDDAKHHLNSDDVLMMLWLLSLMTPPLVWNTEIQILDCHKEGIPPLIIHVFNKSSICLFQTYLDASSFYDTNTTMTPPTAPGSRVICSNSNNNISSNSNNSNTSCNNSINNGTAAIMAMVVESR